VPGASGSAAINIGLLQWWPQSFPAGVRPVEAAFDGTNVWVTNGDSNTVTKIVAATGVTVGTYTVGSSPQGVAFDGTNIWVANQGNGGPGSGTGGSVTKLLASTGAVVGTYSLVGDPYSLAFDGTNFDRVDLGCPITTLQRPDAASPRFHLGAGPAPVQAGSAAPQAGRCRDHRQ